MAHFFKKKLRCKILIGLGPVLTLRWEKTNGQSHSNKRTFYIIETETFLHAEFDWHQI